MADDDKPAKGEEETEREETEEETEREDKTDADIEEIASKAENPDAVRKALKAERAAAKKAREEAERLAAKVKEHEDAQKSDQQKLEERATGAEGEAKQAKLEAARLRVALKKGLTETQAKRLVGESEEDLEKDADELLESFKAEEGDDAPRRPRERLKPGAAPSSEPEESDPAKLAEQVSRGY